MVLIKTNFKRIALLILLLIINLSSYLYVYEQMGNVNNEMSQTRTIFNELVRKFDGHSNNTQRIINGLNEVEFGIYPPSWFMFSNVPITTLLFGIFIFISSIIAMFTITEYSDSLKKFMRIGMRKDKNVGTENRENIETENLENVVIENEENVGSENEENVGSENVRMLEQKV
jgi:hypothetical protein